MLDKAIFGAISALAFPVAYIPYIRGILNRSVKPHAFSWIVWALNGGIVFAAQWIKGAGPGSWLTGVLTLLMIAVALMSLKFGEKHITRGDWTSFLVALAAIPLWVMTEDPTLSVVMLTMADCIGYYPTFRKSHVKPWEENLLTWIICTAGFTLSLFAIEKRSVATVIYPLATMMINVVLISMLVWWRRGITCRGTRA
jgi:hypothetical protein